MRKKVVLRALRFLSISFVGLAGCGGFDLSSLLAGLGSGNSGGTGDGGAAAPKERLVSDLVGPSAASGRAEWTVETARTTFHVEVQLGEAGAVLVITVDGVSVGELTLDATGFGEIEFRSEPDDDPSTDDVAFPDNFPTALQAGGVVQVGELAGTLADDPDDSDDDDSDGDDSGIDDSDDDDSTDGDEDAATTTLRAILTGTGAASGHADWEVGTDRTSFNVEVESGTPGAVLDIVVNSVTVARLTLDATGFGEIEFRDPPDDSPASNEVPFPANFPSPIVEGVVVSAGDLQGTLTAVVSDDSGSDDGVDDGSGGVDDSIDDGSSGGGTETLTSLEATLTGPTAGSGRAEWEVRADRTSFKVEVESGTPGAMLDIIVAGVTVGQLTLDATGFGELEFRDPPDNNPAANEVPFPGNFPGGVGIGTTVSVGLLIGVLQQAP